MISAATRIGACIHSWMLFEHRKRCSAFRCKKGNGTDAKWWVLASGGAGNDIFLKREDAFKQVDLHPWSNRN